MANSHHEPKKLKSVQERTALRAGDSVGYRCRSINGRFFPQGRPRPMSIVISGIGTALPPFWITQEAMAAFSQPFCCEDENQAELLQLIFAHSGVRRRYSMLLHGNCTEGPVPQTTYPVVNCGRGPSTGVRMQEYEKNAPPLAVAAARNPLSPAGLVPG